MVQAAGVEVTTSLQSFQLEGMRGEGVEVTILAMVIS